MIAKSLMSFLTWKRDTFKAGLILFSFFSLWQYELLALVTCSFVCLTKLHPVKLQL